MPRRRRIPLAVRPGLHFGMVASLLGLILFVGAFPVQVSDVPSSPVLNASRFTLPSLAAAVPTGGAQNLTVSPVPLVLSASVNNETARVTDRTEETLEALESEQQNSAAPASTDTSETNDRIPIFFEYEVQGGDTLGQIASRFGVGVNYITWNNVDVENQDHISPGMLLQIPSVEGIVHSVRANETVTEIAERYDADWRDIVAFRANGLDSDPNNIQPGTQILVPGGRKVPLQPVAPPTRPGSSAPVPSSGWTWPVGGMLSSPYGPAHPLGIDVAAPVGTPISAANAGTVVFVGGNPCCSYGYHVIVDHGDGYETLYAHLSDFGVGVGATVNSGDVVGWIGMTGRTTGPHVHFEIRRNGVHQNPMQYLP